VALDLELDDALRREGQARELVRALNDLRKEVGLAIADRVELGLATDDGLWAAVEEHQDYIKAEVLALALGRVEGGEHHLTVDGTPVQVTITRRPA
jgi:isoleucyl-tRNA synthetase